MLAFVFPESACEGFFVKRHLQNYVSSTSSHLHLCTSTFSPISLLIFTSTFTTAHLHLCTSSHPHIDISAHLHLHTSTSLLMFTLCTSLLIFTSSHLHLTSLPLIYISHLHLSLFLTFSLKAGAVPPDRHETQPSAEIVRVGWREMQARVRFVPVRRNPLRRSCVSRCAKCRRECDLSRSRATLCGDRACRAREMQARVRFVPVAGPLRRSCVSNARNAGESAICPGRGATLCGDRACRGREMQARVRFGFVRRNPLRRSCVSRARSAGESAICPGPEQPSAEIVHVECAKCRRECDLVASGATLCGDRACRGCETQARVRVGCVRRNPLRRSCVSSALYSGTPTHLHI